MILLLVNTYTGPRFTINFLCVQCPAVSTYLEWIRNPEQPKCLSPSLSLCKSLAIQGNSPKDACLPPNILPCKLIF